MDESTVAPYPSLSQEGGRGRGEGAGISPGLAVQTMVGNPTRVDCVGSSGGSGSSVCGPFGEAFACPTLGSLLRPVGWAPPPGCEVSLKRAVLVLNRLAVRDMKDDAPFRVLLVRMRRELRRKLRLLESQSPQDVWGLLCCLMVVHPELLQLVCVLGRGRARKHVLRLVWACRRMFVLKHGTLSGQALFGGRGTTPGAGTPEAPPGDTPVGWDPFLTFIVGGILPQAVLHQGDQVEVASEPCAGPLAKHNEPIPRFTEGKRPLCEQKGTAQGADWAALGAPGLPSPDLLGCRRPGHAAGGSPLPSGLGQFWLPIFWPAGPGSRGGSPASRARGAGRAGGGADPAFSYPPPSLWLLWDRTVRTHTSYSIRALCRAFLLA